MGFTKINRKMEMLKILVPLPVDGICQPKCHDLSYSIKVKGGAFAPPGEEGYKEPPYGRNP